MKEEWLEVNGGKIEKKFLEENIAEAKNYSWVEAPFPMDNGHSHCIICMVAIPSKNGKLEKNYKSKAGWLCHYCYTHFLTG